MLKYVHNPRNAMFLTMDPCGWSNDKIAHVECLTKKCQDIGQTAAHTISANVASELIKQDIPEFYDTHQGMALNLSDFLNKCELVAIDELMVQLAERKKVILNAISENNIDFPISVMDEIRVTADDNISVFDNNTTRKLITGRINHR